MYRKASLGNIAQFSKFLNLQVPIGAGGKKLSPARELIRRMNAAGQRLVQKGGTNNEGMYVLNKKGKSGSYQLGQHMGVAVPFQTGFGTMPIPQRLQLPSLNPFRRNKKPNIKTIFQPNFSSDVMIRPKAQAYMIHNHPNSSSLSIPDLMLAKSKKNQIVAYDPSGSKYRAYGTSPQNHYKALVLAETGIQKDINRMINLEKKGYTRDQTDLLLTHARNKALKNMGLIHYSAQIKSPSWTPELKAEAELMTRRFQKRYAKTNKEVFGNSKKTPEFSDTILRLEPRKKGPMEKILDRFKSKKSE